MSFGIAGGVVPPVPFVPALPPLVPALPPLVPALPPLVPALPPLVPAVPPLVPAVPPLSTQLLFEQCWLPVHAWPQVPQFVLLDVVSMQAVPHIIVPLAQLELQVLLLQTWLPVHAIVQLPQWVASDATQEPLHSSVPDGHWQVLFWQVWPPRQGMPHPPQLSESLEVSMQAAGVPHADCPALHDGPVPPDPGLPVVPPLPGELPPSDLTHPAATTPARTKASPSPVVHARIVFITAENSRWCTK
jgi:hypothetical protein